MSVTQLKTATPLDAALREGFQGKAVEFVNYYAHRSVLVKERAVLEERLKVTSGPLYNGEAEQILLFPLLDALRKATSNDGMNTAAVPVHAYQLSAAYALIFDISKISQSKDIANQITLSTIQAQPIIKALLSKADKVNAENETMKDVWGRIEKVLRGKLLYNNPINDDNSGASPLALLYQSIAAANVEAEIESGAVKAWDVLLAYLRHGKGTPLDRGARKTLMMVHSEILWRIDKLIQSAMDDEIAASSEELEAPSGKAKTKGRKSAAFVSTAFIDAYTAMYWYQIYLEAVQQYDIVFPASDVVVQSQAWILIIKTQAAKLKKLFIDIAQVSTAYDIYTAIKLWEEVRDFYRPILNQNLSRVSDMATLWDEAKSLCDKMLSPYAKQQVDNMFTSFKSYMQADYALPENDFKIVSDIADAYQYPVGQEVDGSIQYLAKSGEALLSDLSAQGERSLSIGDREILVVQLASLASSVEDAIGYVKRARETLQLTEVFDDVYHSLIPSGLEWKDPYALSGTIHDFNVASFKRTDPLQVAYEKYTMSPKNTGSGSSTISSLNWRFTPLLMKPFYHIPQLQQFAEDRSPESRILWPGIGELPVGDIISAAYVAQPLPACYTATRNANFVNNDFSAYLTLMSGHSGVTASSRDMFRKIAAILDTYESSYGRAILDNLAAVMFVYRKKDGLDSYELLHPSCPTIYGMPRRAMEEANEVKLSNATDEALLKRSVRFTLESGNSYQFVLHAKVPQPGPYMYVAYPYGKGVYVHIPLLRSIFDAKEDAIQDKMQISFSKIDNVPPIARTGQELDSLLQTISDWGAKDIGSAKFINVLGWAPFLINLPHLLCAYQEQESLMTEMDYKKYSILSVRVRYDEVERGIYVGGFVDNPVGIIDMAAYEEAIYATDPTPLSDSAISDPKPAEPEPANESVRAEAEKAPDPTSISAETTDEGARANAAAATKGPVIGNEGKSIQPLADEGDKPVVKAKPADGNALAGDVGSQTKQEPDTASTTGEDKYWKKIDASGKILEVVKAPSCPEGFVPASEEEYRKYVLDKTAESVESQEESK